MSGIDFDVGRYRYQDRALVLDYVEDALHAADAPRNDPSGSVTVIVRVTAPQMDEPTPEQARGCATKVL